MESFSKKTALLVGLVTVVIVFIWFLHPLLIGGIGEVVMSANSYIKSEKHVNKFSNDVIKYEKFKTNCYMGQDPKSISDLKKYAMKLNNGRPLCVQNYHLFQSIYHTYSRYATIVISKPFMVKLQRWFPGRPDLIEATRNQTLIFIVNLYSYESVVFNTVRANRPVASALEGNVITYINNIVNKTRKTCPFCSYKSQTASDSLGRMESKYSVITANTFKVDKFHSMAILKTHNPLHFTQVQFIDCMDLIMKWFSEVNKVLPDHLYRIIYWDILPKAGAAQVHPVLHVTVGDNSYHARFHRLHFAGMKFSEQHRGLNYWTTLLQLHTALGLSHKFGKASLMAYLNPQKDAEIMILSEKPCLDFFRLVFFTLRAFIDDIQLYALSMSITFPKLNANPSYGDELPMMFRVVYRGSADSSRSDIGSFGFFGTVNVNRDPYKLIKQVKDSVIKRKDEPFTWKWKWND